MYLSSAPVYYQQRAGRVQGQRTTRGGAAARIVAGAAALACLGWGAYWPVRLAVADALFLENTPESVARAAALDPGNAQFKAWQAEMEEHDGRDPVPLLLAALNLNPHDSSVLIRLGLRAEAEGRCGQAERRLREAAAVDRLLLPRATLANYYFRRGEWDSFWLWIGRALAMSYGDAAPLFRLCVSAPGGAARARKVIPQNGGLEEQYLDFLVTQGQLEDAGPVAVDVARRTASREPVLRYCDSALEKGAAASPMAAWNILCRRGLVPYAPLVPDEGRMLTNGGMKTAPLAAGFDWRIARMPEIAVAHVAPSGLRVSLSGRQPERTDLIWQYVPVLPHHTYRFRAATRAEGVSEGGIEWRAAGAAAAAPCGDDWAGAELTFSTGDASLVRLTLIAERKTGSARAEGTVFLKSASLEALP